MRLARARTHAKNLEVYLQFHSASLNNTIKMSDKLDMPLEALIAKTKEEKAKVRCRAQTTRTPARRVQPPFARASPEALLSPPRVALRPCAPAGSLT